MKSNSTKLFSIFKLAVLLLTLTLVVISCSLFSEPEPFHNNIHPPKTYSKTTVLNNYAVDQKVAGDINLDFIAEWNYKNIDSVICYIDSKRVGGLYYSIETAQLYWILINTRQWSNAKHSITFLVYKKASLSDSLGINGFFQDNIFSYTTSLIFNNFPLTAPTNVSVKLQNKNAVITWDPSNSADFKSYIITRNGSEIARINSRNTSTYVDTTIPDFFRGSYAVAVADIQNAYFSPYIAFKKGESLELTIKDALDNMNGQVIFILPNNNLTAVSTQSHAVTKQSANVIDGRWIKNDCNDLFYCFDNNNMLFTFDANSLNLVRTQQVKLTGNAASSSLIDVKEGPDKMYLSVYYNSSNSSLYAFNKDETTLEFSNISPFLKLASSTKLSLSTDGKILLLIGNSNYANNLMKYSIINNSFSFVSQSSVNIPSGYFIEWKNSMLYLLLDKVLTNKAIYEWNLQSMSFAQTIINLNEDYEGTSEQSIIYADSKYLYTVITFRNKLKKYDINTGQLISSWIFSSDIKSVHGAGGRYIFACTATDQWIIDTGVN